MEDKKYTKHLKERLANIFNRKYVFLTGRATTAIYIALRALKIKQGEVILPDILCPSPANAVLYCGLKPVFCDVNIYDYNINIESLNEVITKDRKVIIPVHLFGQPAEMDKIEEIAEDNNLFVIEDVAQALGGEYKGKKLGRFGDISILSFGGKIIDAGDGGALLTDDRGTARNIEEEMQKLPLQPKNKEKMYNIYRRYFYAARDISNKFDKLHFLFLPMPYIFKRMYLYKFDVDTAKKVYFKLETLDKYNKKRRENAEEYFRKLQHPDIIHPKYKYYNDGTVYRYSILVKKDQKKVTESIRKSGYDASNLYPPLHKMYLRHQKERTFENAEFVGKHIINLWVEPRVTKEYIEGVCETIIDSLNKIK